MLSYDAPVLMIGIARILPQDWNTLAGVGYAGRELMHEIPSWLMEYVG